MTTEIRGELKAPAIKSLHPLCASLGRKGFGGFTTGSGSGRGRRTGSRSEVKPGKVLSINRKVCQEKNGSRGKTEKLKWNQICSLEALKKEC